MGELNRSSQEFDRSRFPELMGCKVMPSTEEGLTEVEVQDAEGNLSVAKVPNQAVRRTNMPLVVEKMKEDAVLPGEVLKPFEDAIAIGLLYCRVTEKFDEHGLLRVELPATEGTSSLIINENQLGRRR